MKETSEKLLRKIGLLVFLSTLYMVGFGASVAMAEAHWSSHFLEDGLHYFLSAIVWPITLPLTAVIHEPFLTISILLTASAVLYLVPHFAERLRNRREERENERVRLERLLRSEGIDLKDD